ncbi:MAG: hypothetical protein Q8Q33_09915 [Chlamydiota bacterium]|nr:hypothetical protein [Chlamydiota bacterium]
MKTEILRPSTVAKALVDKQDDGKKGQDDGIRGYPRMFLSGLVTFLKIT